MSLTPGYGETPVPDDELDALLPDARELMGKPTTKSAIYDLEQALQNEVAERALTSVLDGTLTVADLLSDSLLRDLHSQLYGDIWAWAGVYRKRELNIGVAPEHVAVELRGSFETIRYRWEHTTDWTPRQLGAVVHAEVGRIHPFADGNGRSSRLLADLVFVAAQDSDTPDVYDWRLDKRRYIDLLRQYDRHRDPRELADFLSTQPLDS